MGAESWKENTDLTLHHRFSVLPTLQSAFGHSKRQRNTLKRKIKLKKTSSFRHLNLISESVGWKELWDSALDHGPSCVESVKTLVGVISYPDHATSKCPKCDIAELDSLALPDHIILNHTNSLSSFAIHLNSNFPDAILVSAVPAQAPLSLVRMSSSVIDAWYCISVTDSISLSTAVTAHWAQQLSPLSSSLPLDH